ncbi:DUF1385 domain-containing protein [Anaerofilum sp. BX8]|uniref:DUF1385 domain-containing protein n=1 Tax=Anaerofilum hominis TaxID=2763016 RepID=A0A923I4W4_9FIRM|nr:DUF1385 domain-containing protein [Anaerofilum hominis]MBC5580381.1 DUF1385 domain-containing protein [Anaerofilum hominis]
MSRHNLKEKFKTSVGGQALIEGVMMRGPSKLAIAVRDPAGEIQVETTDVKPNPVARVPVLRGVVSFIDSLLVGYRAIMRSAEISMTEEEKAEEQSGFDRWLEEHLGEKGMSALMTVSALAGGLLAIVLFMVLPTFFTGLLGRFVELGSFRAVVEGTVKLGLFVLYLFLISRMKEINRLFRYHGAEHKTIATYEAGEPLTVENVRGNSRFHPRCGTNFLLLVLVVSILAFSFVPWHSTLGRVGLKLLLLPLVMGFSYELIKFAGRHDNLATRIICAPGLWLQRLTTAEPDDSMIEVAIASVKAVLPAEGEDDRW